VGRSASELSWRSVRSRGRLRRRSRDTSARYLDGVSAGAILRGGRWVRRRSVLGGRHNRDRSLSDVDDLNGGGSTWSLLLLGLVVGRSVGGLVSTVDGGVLGLFGTVDGSGLLSRGLGLVTTVAGAGWLSGHGRNAGNVGGWCSRLGDGVGDDGWAAVVADVDRGDRVTSSALVADSLGDGLGLGGDTSGTRVNVGGGDDLDGGAGWDRWVVLARHAGDGRRVCAAVDGSWD
jgi:hypothetical protein